MRDIHLYLSLSSFHLRGVLGFWDSCVFRICPGSPFDCPPRHLGSKIRFLWTGSDLVFKSGNRLGSIAALVLHGDLHGPTGNVFDAVAEDDGEKHRRDVSLLRVEEELVEGMTVIIPSEEYAVFGHGIPFFSVGPCEG